MYGTRIENTEQLNRSLINNLLISSAILGIIAYGTIIIRSMEIGWGLRDILQMIAASGLIITALLRHRLETRLKTLFLILLYSLAGAAGVYTLGMLAGLVFIFPVAAVILAIFFSARTTIIYTITYLLFFAIVGSRYVSGRAHPPVSADFMVTSVIHWIVYGVCLTLFFVVTCMTVIRYRGLTEMTIEKLSNQAELLPSGIIEFDPDLKITFMNKAGHRLTGYSEKDVQGGINGFDLFLPEDHSRVTGRMAQYQVGEHVPPTEYSIIKQDGTQAPVLLKTVALLQDGRMSGYMSSLTEIGKIKEAEEKIRRNLQEKEVLLQEIHHRVKNNMQVILSLLDLQAGSITDPRALDILRVCKSRVHAMSAVHETLHDTDEFSEIDLQAYLSKVTSAVYHLHAVDPDRIDLVSHVDALPISINQAYPLGLIINELISNSLKHAFPEGRNGMITVSSTSNARTLELTVADNGVGLPEGSNLGGSGSLGLKLVFSLAEDQLGGTVTVNGASGTEITIQINHEP